MTTKSLIYKMIKVIIDLFFFIIIGIVCVIRSFKGKTGVIGLGPEPLINNIYHKKALEEYGYIAKTFVRKVYYISDNFDIRFDKIFTGRVSHFFSKYFIFIYIIWSFDIIYLYFSGASLSLSGSILGRFEPYFFKMAGVKTVLMPYGSDIANMNFSKELKYKSALSRDYPLHRKKLRSIESNISMWVENADFILAGCDWVDYLPGWDRLCLAHFSIDINQFKKEHISNKEKSGSFTIVHAPNHKNIKGSLQILDAISKLQTEGLNIQLNLIEKKSNLEVLNAIRYSDLVIDQLIIGWYAMFAIEAMSMGKPVVTFIREDLLDLYLSEGILSSVEEFPLISSTTLEIESTIKYLYYNRDFLNEQAIKGVPFVEKYHSIQSIGLIFDEINKKLI